MIRAFSPMADDTGNVLSEDGSSRRRWTRSCGGEIRALVKEEIGRVGSQTLTGRAVDGLSRRGVGFTTTTSSSKMRGGQRFRARTTGKRWPKATSFASEGPPPASSPTTGAVKGGVAGGIPPVPSPLQPMRPVPPRLEPPLAVEAVALKPSAPQPQPATDGCLGTTPASPIGVAPTETGRSRVAAIAGTGCNRPASSMRACRAGARRQARASMPQRHD